MDTSISTVAQSIASLDGLMGVTIRNIDEIPPDCTRLMPILIPEPLNFVTNFVSTRDSFGTPTAAQKTLEYDLNYTFMFVQVGSGRTGLDFYDDMISRVEMIIDAILDNDTITGAVDLSPQGTTDFGPVPDPAGNQYLGCRLVFHVIEYS